MALEIEPQDYQFLLCSIKFCNHIDEYKSILNLDFNTVEEFKNDHEILIHVFDNAQRFASCAESFVRFQVGNIREHFINLSEDCKRSRHYTIEIGVKLGIEPYAFHYN
ncbi:MAG: hypothetical protein U0V74_13075 [Chitinophagales bacterium]